MKLTKEFDFTKMSDEEVKAKLKENAYYFNEAYLTMQREINRLHHLKTEALDETS